MADLLTLTWSTDDEAAQDTFNMLDFAQGLTLADGGWIPQAMLDGQVTCTETLTFYATGGSHDHLAGFVQKLDDWKRMVEWSRSKTQKRIAWFSARWKSETNARRAAIWSLDYKLGDSPFAPYLRDSNFMASLTITIVRGNWEELVYVSEQTDYFSTNGGKTDLGASVNGDIAARLRQAYVIYDGTPTSQRYTWIGFRAAHNGVPANFAPNWELESSTYLLGGGDTSVVADATASGGNKITTTFAGGTSLLTRFKINAESISPVNYADQRGLFLCLLRAKMSDASTARVRVSSGFVSSGTSNSSIVNPRTTISGTSWMLYEMGTVRLPAYEHKFGISGIENYMGIIGDAERVSGSGNLEMDELILIPMEDGYIKIDAQTDRSAVYIFTNPDEVTAAHGASAFQQVDIEPVRWGFPIDSAVYVVGAACGNTSHTLTGTMAFVMGYIRRWRTLRGTE